MSNKTVTHEGKVYQVDETYATSNGQIVILKDFDIELNQFVCMYDIFERLTTAFKEVLVSEYTTGTIEDAPIEIELRKQGKTVVDAVNKLGVSCLYKYVNYSIVGDCFSITDNHEVADNYYRVCAIEEFNRCVKEMSNFAGVDGFVQYQAWLSYANQNGLDKTLEPSKPRTKVEYVKVDKNVEGGAYWECAREFAEGLVGTFWRDGRRGMMIQDNEQLLSNYKKGSLYRKVVTEITWQGEVREFIAGCEEISINTSFTEVLTYGYLNGELTKEACNDDSQIAFVDEFIEMCNLVTSLTK